MPTVPENVAAGPKQNPEAGLQRLYRDLIGLGLVGIGLAILGRQGLAGGGL